MVSNGAIESPALIGLKKAGVAIIQGDVTKTCEGQEQAEVMADLEKNIAAAVG